MAIRFLIVDIGAILLFLVVYGFLAWRLWWSGRETEESLYELLDK